MKQVLVYTSTSALAAAGLVLSGTLIVLLVKQLSNRGTKTPAANGRFVARDSQPRWLQGPKDSGLIKRV